MPVPSVEPMPPVSRLERFTVPLEAQEASYFAASERIASFAAEAELSHMFTLCSLAHSSALAQPTKTCSRNRDRVT